MSEVDKAEMEIVPYGEFLDRVFPRKEAIEKIPIHPEHNDIIQVQGIVYGEIGSGKTMTVNTIADYLIRRYGRENVGVSWTRKNLRTLLEYGIKDKLVNYLVCEDLTSSDVDRITVSKFFDLRHLIREKTGRRNGLVVTFLTCHRFHGLKSPELRTDCKIFIAKSMPFNPFNEWIARKFIGEELGKQLEILEGKKEENPEYKGISAVYYARKRYLVNFPLVNEYYLKELKIPVKQSTPYVYSPPLRSETASVEKTKPSKPSSSFLDPLAAIIGLGMILIGVFFIIPIILILLTWLGII